EGGEALDLHQLGTQLRVESEIGLYEHGYGVFARRMVRGGNGRARLPLIPWVGEQLLHHLAPVARHGIDQAAGKEAQRFAVAKRHGLAATLLQQGEKARVLRLRVVLVKALAM